jgi:hypothetical protein
MNRLNAYPMLASTLRAASALIVLLSAAATPASAYVDPGTGAMLLQMTAAVFAGALFYFRSFWKRVAAWFGGRQDGKRSADRTQPEQ